MGIPEEKSARNPSSVIVDWTFNLVMSFLFCFVLFLDLVLEPLFFTSFINQGYSSTFHIFLFAILYIFIIHNYLTSVKYVHIGWGLDAFIYKRVLLMDQSCQICLLLLLFSLLFFFRCLTLKQKLLILFYIGNVSEYILFEFLWLFYPIYINH